MKNLILLIILTITISCAAQDSEYLKLWNKYVDDCEVIVKDTITEYGNVKYKMIITDGLITLTPIDTSWTTAEREEYKDYNYGNLLLGSSQRLSFGAFTPATYTINSTGTLGESIVFWGDNTISTSISRTIVYDLKAKRPTQEDFWEWLKLNNYRK